MKDLLAPATAALFAVFMLTLVGAVAQDEVTTVGRIEIGDTNPIDISAPGSGITRNRVWLRGDGMWTGVGLADIASTFLSREMTVTATSWTDVMEASVTVEAGDDVLATITADVTWVGAGAFKAFGTNLFTLNTTALTEQRVVGSLPSGAGAIHGLGYDEANHDLYAVTGDWHLWKMAEPAMPAAAEDLGEITGVASNETPATMAYSSGFVFIETRRRTGGVTVHNLYRVPVAGPYVGTDVGGSDSIAISGNTVYSAGDAGGQDTGTFASMPLTNITPGSASSFTVIGNFPTGFRPFNEAAGLLVIDQTAWVMLRALLDPSDVHAYMFNVGSPGAGTFLSGSLIDVVTAANLGSGGISPGVPGSCQARLARGADEVSLLPAVAGNLRLRIENTPFVDAPPAGTHDYALQVRAEVGNVHGCDIGSEHGALPMASMLVQAFYGS